MELMKFVLFTGLLLALGAEPLIFSALGVLMVGISAYLLNNSAWRGRTRLGLAGKARRGAAGPGRAWLGRHGKASRGLERRGRVWFY